MDGRVDETSHVISPCKFENIPTNNKKYKEQILKEIIIGICAMLNSNGGKVVLYNECKSDRSLLSSQMSLVVRILEQSMISITGSHLTVTKIDFKEDKENIVASVEKADSLITTNYNLYLPSQSQVVQVDPWQPPEHVKDTIINRKVVPKPVQLDSHWKIFLKDKNCGLQENKVVQLKHIKADQSKRIRLADRMTGKGNKFSCYVSAFTNYNGGHIYYGITDDGIVEGESIPEVDKREITKKVDKTINKMTWPEQIGQPKRGEQWDIFFEPVLDENSKVIPSISVIVIYIAPCLGGVFTEEPECYEMVEGKVKKMPFTTWKKRIMQPVWLHNREEIPLSVQRTTWSSDKARKAFSDGHKLLMPLINNGNWDAILKEGESLEKKLQLYEMTNYKLLVLSKQVTACFRRGRFSDARAFLQQYTAILPQAEDRLIFEVMELYLQAALNRASGDIKALKELLAAAFSKAELIEPGLVTATVYIFAATVTDLIKDPTNKTILPPDILSKRALEHLECVPAESSDVLANIKKKIHITLATFYLGWNISGQRITDIVDISSLDKAKKSIMAVYTSVHDGNQLNPLSEYHHVQLKLVQSIYYYRHSEVYPDRRTRLLHDAFDYAQKAECLARDCKFTEMVEWGKATKALCTEELERTRSLSTRKSIQPEDN